MISKAIVDGVMQAKLEELAEPTPQHRQVARTIMAAGGHQVGNRAERRAAKSMARKAEARARAERQRTSRGQVPA